MIQVFKPFVSEEAINSVNEVLKSGWIGLGPKTEEFEEAFARFVGARYAVAMNSCTAALHLATVVSGVGVGDEVLTTALTFVSTNAVVLYQSAHPIFVDVEDGTLNMDLSKAEALISPRTKAIMAVHYGGNPIDLDALYAFARTHNLTVIEDAAHACGALFRGRRIGSFGLTCFSFHAVKNLPIGDGGMVTTNDEGVYQHLMRLRWMGIDRSTFARSVGKYQWEYDVNEVGYKYHMNDIAAAIGIEHLKRVDEWNRRRADIVAMYRSELAGLEPQVVRFLKQTEHAVSANHLCVVRVRKRDEVVRMLGQNGIGVGVHYKPNYWYSPFTAGSRGPLETTEKAYKEIISLPLHLLLTDDDVSFVCKTLRKVVSALD